MFVAVRRIEVARRNEVIHRGDAGGDRVSPGDALHRRQPREGQIVRPRIHTDVGVKENVQLLLGDLAAGLFQMMRQDVEGVGALDG